MNWLRKTDVRPDHQYAEDRLSAYLDGELSPQERMAVDRHLAVCPACRWQLDTLRQTVQWTRALPALSVPRVFTIPPFSEPVPAPRPRRTFVPVLQGATALVALLLFFVVAGDVLLTGVLPAAAPQPAMVTESAAFEVEVTQEVEMRVEATPVLAEPPAAPAEAEAAVAKAVPAEAEAAVAKAVPEAEATAVLETVPAAEAPAVPEVMSAAETPVMEAPAMEAVDATATLAPEVGVTGAMGLGGGGPETPTTPEEMEVARVAALAVTASPVVTEALALADAAQPSPTSLPPTPTPEPSPVPVPTAVAAAQEAGPALVEGANQAPIPAAAGAPAAGPTGWQRAPHTLWLRIAELGLGAALVVLAAITIIVMVQQRRAR